MKVPSARALAAVIRLTGRVRRAPHGAWFAVLLLSLPPVLPGCELGAQNIESVRPALLAEVMPGADRFEAAEGGPPAKVAYRGDQLLGYVFITSDFLPEPEGYSGTIRALVGLDGEGRLTGVRLVEYRESRRYDWGDFLSDPGLLDQFPGKPVDERFRVGQDIDGIAQVTISVQAMARGIRDAARRVALAYISQGPRTPLSDSELVTLSWYELRRRGAVATMSVAQQGRAPFELSVLQVPTQAVGEYLVGRRYEVVVGAIEKRGGADHVLLYVLPGTGFQPPMRDGWSIEQGSDTVAVPTSDVVFIGTPGGGALSGEASQVGALLLDEEDVDITAPLTVAFNRGRPERGTFRAEYVSQAALARMSEPAPIAGAPAEAVAVAPVPPVAEVVDQVEAAVPPGPAAQAPVVAEVAEGPPPSELPAEAIVPLERVEIDPGMGDQERRRVGWVVLVIVLAGLAFFLESSALRWVSLATTLIVLGWMDGGFLSITHLTGLIWVGPSAIVSDLPLLIMVGATVVSLVLWGRVFCGYLCPFGALQDFIERLVPRRFKRELPRDVHRVALKAKYVILAIILLPAIAGSHVSLYQYFEPFGTVFFVGRNALLWVIAGSILVAAAVVPRFYCRYACPLGASLALASQVSVRRVPRVEQCGYCKVCAQHCPSGAFDGSRLDFKECVRCNGCEVRLAEKSGVCRHGMDEFRPRLVHIEARPRVAETQPRI